MFETETETEIIFYHYIICMFASLVYFIILLHNIDIHNNYKITYNCH